MVKLNRIYTKTGDDGSTGLADGTRRSKSDLRLESYGTVDELNSVLGLAVNALREGHPTMAGHAGDRGRPAYPARPDRPDRRPHR
jgi:cob(I)alamin adenosyltransferase